MSQGSGVTPPAVAQTRIEALSADEQAGLDTRAFRAEDFATVIVPVQQLQLVGVDQRTGMLHFAAIVVVPPDTFVFQKPGLLTDANGHIPTVDNGMMQAACNVPPQLRIPLRKSALQVKVVRAGLPGLLHDLLGDGPTPIEPLPDPFTLPDAEP